MGYATLQDTNNNALAFTATTLGFQLPVTPTATVMLIDTFDGTTIDTAYRWQTPIVAGSGTMTQSGGSLVATTGTTASNAAAITSIENFPPNIGNVTGGGLIICEASPGINTNRCMGFYTRPVSWTAATPVQDGYVWELDITGAWAPSIYNAGSRIFRGSPTYPTAQYMPLIVAYQGLNVSFYYGSLTNPVLTVPVLQPSTCTLPFGFHCINHTAGPAGSPTWNMSAIAVFDASGVCQSVWNGQSLSRQRFPGKFIPLNAISVAAETTIWAPATGRRFRLMGYVLDAGTVAGNIVLKDNTAGTTILILPLGVVGSPLSSPPMGNGILSVAVNNVLTATGIATQTLSGYLFGTEE